MAFAAKLPQKLPHAAPGGRASLYSARNRHTGLKAPGIIKALPRLGAIIGDFVGSPWEFHLIKTTQFPLLCERNGVTDDSIVAVAGADNMTDVMAALRRLVDEGGTAVERAMLLWTQGCGPDAGSAGVLNP